MKKTLLGALGVIILGALGSGLWELIKPLLGWAWSGVLTITTLGLDSLRDGIYADTANAIEKSSGIIVGAIFLTGAMVISSIRLSFRPTTPYRLPLTSSVVLLIASMSFLVTSVRTNYVTRLAVYTTKLETIAAPHLSEAQLKQFRARAVQVNSRADYLVNIEALRKVIEAAGQKAPSREFF